MSYELAYVVRSQSISGSTDKNEGNQTQDVINKMWQTFIKTIAKIANAISSKTGTGHIIYYLCHHDMSIFLNLLIK